MYFCSMDAGPRSSDSVRESDSASVGIRGAGWQSDVGERRKLALWVRDDVGHGTH